MALNKPGRCRRCGKPYTSTTHMRECRGMTIKQRNAARSHRAAIQRASRHRAGNIFAELDLESQKPVFDSLKSAVEWIKTQTAPTTTNNAGEAGTEQ